MIWKVKLLRPAVSFLCLAVLLTVFYLVCRKIISLPFRAANDYLHEQNAPITLDFLIPGGVYISEKMSIGDVLTLRLEKPKDRVDLFIRKISETIPVRYRLLGTTLLYLFWVFLFFIFLRVFTWARYSTALAWSFLFGAVVYFFMPDLILGRIDDAVFLAWAVGFWIARRCWARRKRARSSSA